eukprot:scaffold66279_cov24-Prasinocladus_malaysianus.AAC.1
MYRIPSTTRLCGVDSGGSAKSASCMGLKRPPIGVSELTYGHTIDQTKPNPENLFGKARLPLKRNGKRPSL